ncbi:unnamed protein product [Ixodes persulcatus]
MCTRTKPGEMPPDHRCFKNWQGSSTSMEKDIIVEGFCQSVVTHGVKYTRLIADGDSSTYRAILEAAPYGNQVVQKIECRNHILRNYSGHLREVAQRKRSTPVPAALRNLVLQSSVRLRFGVATAIKARAAGENRPLPAKTEDLARDIRNGPSHVFGQHDNCAPYFCKGPKPGEVNHVPELKRCGLYDEVAIAANRVANNASSLILDVDNNSAEHVNSLVAKFVGGKRINYSQRGSYRLRCLGASVAFNSPGEYHRAVHKSVCKNSPGKYTKVYQMALASRRAARKKQKLLQQPRARRCLITASSSRRCGPDADYGPQAQQPDMEPEKFQHTCQVFLESLRLSDEGRSELERATQGQAACPRWKEERKKRLTASSFGKVCKMKPTTSCTKTVVGLLYKEFSSPATQYGNDQEPLALRRLEADMGVSVETCGLFVDREHLYLGASPDGLVNDDSLVEVKSSYTARGLTVLEGVKQKNIKCVTETDGRFSLIRTHNFWYQVQGQLHITGRQFCLFVVWTGSDISIEKIARDDQFWEVQMLPQLQKFYRYCLLPEIVDPRQSRSMPIRDPDYILEAIREKAQKAPKTKKVKK